MNPKTEVVQIVVGRHQRDACDSFITGLRADLPRSWGNPWARAVAVTVAVTAGSAGRPFEDSGRRSEAAEARIPVARTLVPKAEGRGPTLSAGPLASRAPEPGLAGSRGPSRSGRGAPKRGDPGGVAGRLENDGVAL